jgi:BirA family transcriptional regulator, biotin operon repressor / biotin---[acetyl-CoA-carboxylase] ligase
MPRDGLPDLPTLFEPIALREGADAMARAVELAPEKGAGTLCWVRAYRRLEAAVVLEPEQHLAAARPAVLAAANAACDALAALGPPEVAIQLRWPATIIVNAGVVGAARLATPPRAVEYEVPDWLVVGVELRLVWPEGHEPGLLPGETSLGEEGFGELDNAEWTAAWARHLMAGFADWQARGFQKLAEKTLARLEHGPWMGQARRGLDPATGDLVLEENGARQSHPLREALAA